ncbi:MAG: ribosome maturation factor RimM [Gammaproteobacteria bacterium]
MDLVQQDDEASEKIVLGRITGVYGVKGWVKIFSYTDPMEAIVDYSPWYIRPENRKSAAWSKIKLKAGKRQAKTVVAQLEHCSDRDEAQAYIGFEIAIEPDQLESLSETNEFYWRDLMGLRVINQQGIELGVVTNIFETGANDVLVVTSEEAAEAGHTEAGHTETEHKAGNKERLIPWTMQQAIIAVDLEQGIIEVDWDPDF